MYNNQFMYGASNMMYPTGVMPSQVGGVPQNSMMGYGQGFQATPQQWQQQQQQQQPQQQQQQPPPHQQQPQQPQHQHQHQHRQQRHYNNNAGGNNNVGGGYNSNGGAEGNQGRRRNNDIGEVSRVLHLRNVTPEVTQLSIQNLILNFGSIKQIVMLRQMNQALVEMESELAAKQLVEFFSENGFAEVDGRRVYIRYSNHHLLTATQQVTRTLLVSMFNTQFDVSSQVQITPEIVYDIFSSFGTVQKIVVLPKNHSSERNHNRVQALVQFDTNASAEHIKNIMQGQPVTIGGTVNFTLDIQFSRMDEIKTTNPSTSLIVDEEGNTHRPAGTTPQQQQQPPQAMYPATMVPGVPMQPQWH